jgi:glycosyltransferase involved in cell wall biosynthesis
MSSPPKVSILVPVYNRADYVEQALACALDQTFGDFEVVVVDNCSTDGSWELIQRVAARDERVRVFRNDSNIGPVRNWQRCVREARGELGKIIWSDDLLHHEYLAQAVPIMADTAVGFVYSPAVIFFGEDPLDGLTLYTNTPAGCRPTAEFIEGSLLKRDYPVSPGCALFRLKDMRDCFLDQVPNRVGSDFAMHAIGPDVLLFLLVAERYPCFYRLPQPLSYFRAHTGAITVSEGKGKIALHYDIAKAWFVSRGNLLPSLAARFNSVLFVDLLVFRGKQYGLRRRSDFYPEEGRHPLSVTYVPVAVAQLSVRVARQILPWLRRSLAGDSRA